MKAPWTQLADLAAVGAVDAVGGVDAAALTAQQLTMAVPCCCRGQSLLAQASLCLRVKDQPHGSRVGGQQGLGPFSGVVASKRMGHGCHHRPGRCRRCQHHLEFWRALKRGPEEEPKTSPNQTVRGSWRQGWSERQTRSNAVASQLCSPPPCCGLSLHCRHCHECLLALAGASKQSARGHLELNGRGRAPHHLWIADALLRGPSRPRRFLCSPRGAASRASGSVERRRGREGCQCSLPCPMLAVLGVHEVAARAVGPS